MLLTTNDRNNIEIIKTYSVASFEKLFNISNIYVATDRCYVRLTNGNISYEPQIALYNNEIGISRYVVSHIKYHNQDMYMVHSIYDFQIKDEDFIKICEEMGINPFDKAFEVESNL